MLLSRRLSHGRSCSVRGRVVFMKHATTPGPMRPKTPAWLAAVYWIGFVILASNVCAAHTQPQVLLVSLVTSVLCGILAFRYWCARRGFKIAFERSGLALDRPCIFHLAVLWSLGWRSFLILVSLALVLGAGLGARDGGRAVGTVIGLWCICAISILDVPFWVGRRVRAIRGVET